MTQEVRLTTSYPGEIDLDVISIVSLLLPGSHFYYSLAPSLALLDEMEGCKTHLERHSYAVIKRTTLDIISSGLEC